MTDLARLFLTERRLARLEAMARQRLGALTVLFERPYDEGNLSAAARSAEAFGLACIHVSVTPRLRLQRKPSADACRWLPVRWHALTLDAMASLRADGYTLAATVPAPLIEPPGGPPPPGDPTTPYDRLTLPPRLALVFGNEHEGLTPEALAACELRLTIPTWGFTESLNLSNSAAILVAHFAARYRAERGESALLPEAEWRPMLEEWIDREVRVKLRGRAPPSTGAASG